MHTSPLRVVVASAAIAVADFKAVYTWRTWLFGWLGRMLAQVTFFALVARLLGRPDQLAYLVLGNAVMTCAIEAMVVVASSSWERDLGTLPLLSAAPAQLFWVFVGRSMQWPLSGAGTSLVALFVLGPLFGVHWRAEQVPVVVLLVLLAALGTYCVGLCLAGLTITMPELRNIISNVAYLLMMAFCGVQVPLSFWPGWIRALAQFLPLTHALAAVRRVADGGAGSAVLAQAALAVAAAAGWFALAYVAFGVQQWRGRRAGLLYLT